MMDRARRGGGDGHGGDEGLVLRDVVAGYGRTDVVKGVDLGPLVPGEVTALVGPNATGKSTLLRSIAGLVRTSGSIRLDGVELAGRPVREVSRRVSFMPQDPPGPLDISVLESVLSALHATGVRSLGGDGGSGGEPGSTASDAVSATPLEPRERCFAALERIGILHLALEPLRRLSGGQRQLVGLAQTLVRAPRLLLLDEPTSALDLRFQVVVMSTIRELAREGRIVVIVLHDLTLAARWSQRIALLDGGHLVASAPPAEALNPESLLQVYGVDGRVERCSQGTLQVIVDGARQGAAGGAVGAADAPP